MFSQDIFLFLFGHVPLVFDDVDVVGDVVVGPQQVVRMHEAWQQVFFT